MGSYFIYFFVLQQTDFQDQFALLQHNLDEERERRERLEEQINDLMELHQNEVPNIRQVSQYLLVKAIMSALCSDKGCLYAKTD